jgi:SAM-dependent methyltransferase
MDRLDTIQIVLVVLLSILIANYVYLKWSMRANRTIELDGVEGFANPEGPDGTTIILGNEHLYDEFYSKVYDTIVEGGTRQEAEIGFTLAWVKGFRPEVETIQALDVGCGTGRAVELLKKAGVAKAVGLDASDAMVAMSRKKFPSNDYRVGEIEQI